MRTICARLVAGAGAPWRRPHLVVVAAFILLGAVGLATFADYGIPYDEDQQRRLGNLALDYILDGDPRYLTNTYGNRYYGPAFEILLAANERLLGEQPDSRLVFRARRLGTFAAYFAAVIAFYALVHRRTGSAWWGLAGGTLLVLSPRIWADAFYNSKDLGFLSFFVIAANLVDACVARPSGRRAVLAGAAVAFATDVRIAGILLLPLAWALLAVVGLQRRAPWKDLGIAAGLFSITAVGGIILCWPLLWGNAGQTVVITLRQMAHYPWDGTVLYLGQLTRASQLPWHYLPVWIAVSTPLATTALALFGAGIACWRLRARAGRGRATLPHDLLALAWLGVPVLVVLALDSVLYDAWRQMFFVYPGLVLLAVIGLEPLVGCWTAATSRRARALSAIALGVVGLNLVTTLGFMIRWHPHQNVYLNALAGWDRGALRQRFELDYWGLSYRPLLEAIVAADQRPMIAVYAATFPGVANAQMLPPAPRARLTYVTKPEDADYVVTTFRRHPEDYPYPDEAFSVWVAGTKIAAAYRLR
jgi:hypothetical protein